MDEVIEGADNCLIADAALPRTGVVCRTVLVASPRLLGFYRLHRREGFRVGCMPVWELYSGQTG